MIDVYQADDADDRRVGPDLPVHDRHAARPRARRRGLLRRLHRQHAHRRRRLARRRGRDRRLGAGAGRAGRLRRARCSTWLDGRNGSSFGIARLERQHADLHDRRRRRARTACRRCCPTQSAGGALTGVTRGGSPVATVTRTIKGVEYAVFDAAAGRYAATYAVDDTPPVISRVAATPATDGTATVTWTTDEPADSRVDYGTVAELARLERDRRSAPVTSHTRRAHRPVAGHHLLLPRDLDRRARATRAPRRRAAARRPPSRRRPRASPTRPSPTSAPATTGRTPTSPTPPTARSSWPGGRRRVLGREPAVGWSATPWTRPGGTRPSPAALSVDGARVGTSPTLRLRALDRVRRHLRRRPLPARRLRRRLNDQPWAIFSTGAAASSPGQQQRVATRHALLQR